VADSASIRLAAPAAIGRAKRLDDAEGRYIEAVKASVPRAASISAASGSWSIAPMALPGGAHRAVVPAPSVLLAVSPDGFNINGNCGSTHPALLAGARRDAQRRHVHSPPTATPTGLLVGASTGATDRRRSAGWRPSPPVGDNDGDWSASGVVATRDVQLGLERSSRRARKLALVRTRWATAVPRAHARRRL
jgi:phosphoglucosamine mutase